MAEYKFLDDLAKFGNTTVTAMGGIQRQVSKWVAEQTTTLIKGMDIVTKQEVEGYINTIAALEARVTALEVKLAAKAKPAAAEAAAEAGAETVKTEKISKPKTAKK